MSFKNIGGHVLFNLNPVSRICRKPQIFFYLIHKFSLSLQIKYELPNTADTISDSLCVSNISQNKSSSLTASIFSSEYSISFEYRRAISNDVRLSSRETAASVPRTTKQLKTANLTLSKS